MSRLRHTLSALAALVVVMIAPASARAAGEVGPHFQAEVICNFYDHEISLNASMKIAPGYDRQTVAWRFWVVNTATNRGFYVMNGDDPAAGAWFSTIHDRVQYLHDTTWNTYSISYSDWIVTGEKVLRISGDYVVYTQYAWYSGYWVYSSWVKTTSYNWQYGLNGASYCHA